MKARFALPFLVAAATAAVVADAFAVVPDAKTTMTMTTTRLRAAGEEASSAAVESPPVVGEDDDDDDRAVLDLPMFLDGNNDDRPASAMDPDEMILIAKRFLASKGGFGADESFLARSFTFEGPVVGPIARKEWLEVIGSVDIDAGFPDGFRNQFYGFHVDPIETDRVWWTSRGTGKNTGPLLPFVPEESGTGRTVESPPQVSSVTIDPTTKLVTKYTIGYVVDRNAGNTGGLGGLYGLLYALGRPLPFPEANPWRKSVQYDLFQKIGGILNRFL